MATTLNNLALIYQAQGRHKEAQPLHRRALAIAEKSLGPDHPNIVKFLSNLAALYEKMGKPREATGFSARAEAMEKRLAGRK